MQITINTAEPLSDVDVAVLRTLLGESAETPVSAPVAAKAAPAAKKAAPKAEKAAPAPEPEEEPEAEADEDLVGGDDDAPTMEDAVALATKLVSSGQAAKVKAALGEVGAKKVSEIKAGDIATFVNALS
jgi:hypothetical protein